MPPARHTAPAGSGSGRGSGYGSSMTRDELLLAALAAGEVTTAGLVRSTGVSERNCRYGLRRLIVAGYAWSPERGRWRLTEAGRAIASGLPELPATDRPHAQSIATPPSPGGTSPAVETREASGPQRDSPAMPALLGWALTGIAAVVVWAIARRLPTSLPAPPSSAPTAWPYDGWRIGGPWQE